MQCYYRFFYSMILINTSSLKLIKIVICFSNQQIMKVIELHN